MVSLCCQPLFCNKLVSSCCHSILLIKTRDLPNFNGEKVPVLMNCESFEAFIQNGVR